jgi:hypothetical protein
MQTEPTLAILEQMTALLGEQYRLFVRETENIKTLELPKEAERRMKAASKKSSKKSPSPDSNPGPVPMPSQTTGLPGFRIIQAASNPGTVSVSSGKGIATGSGVTRTQSPVPARVSPTKQNTRRAKKLNISTFKFHAIGHYPRVIRHFGPSDLFSTLWVRSSMKITLIVVLTDSTL